MKAVIRRPRTILSPREKDGIRLRCACTTNACARNQKERTVSVRSFLPLFSGNPQLPNTLPRPCAIGEATLASRVGRSNLVTLASQVGHSTVERWLKKKRKRRAYTGLYTASVSTGPTYAIEVSTKQLTTFLGLLWMLPLCY